MTGIAVTCAAPTGLLGLVVGLLVYRYLRRQPIGTELMAGLAASSSHPSSPGWPDPFRRA